MPTRGGQAEVAAPHHQGGQIIIGLLAGIQPVALALALQIRRALRAERGTPGRGRTALITADKGGLVDEAVLEHHPAQGFHHGQVAAAQGLLFQLVERLAELTEDLLDAIEKMLALQLQALGFGLLSLMIGQPQPSRGKQHGGQQPDQQGRWPGAKQGTTQARQTSRHGPDSTAESIRYSSVPDQDS